jgi:hypothetical protein
MATPSFYGDGHTPRKTDAKLRVLQKILGSGIDGGGGGGGGTPGGADTQVQFNNAGAFGGDARLAWSAAFGQLSIFGNLYVDLDIQVIGTANIGGSLTVSGDLNLNSVVEMNGAAGSVSIFQIDPTSYLQIGFANPNGPYFQFFGNGAGGNMYFDAWGGDINFRLDAGGSASWMTLLDEGSFSFLNWLTGTPTGATDGIKCSLNGNPGYILWRAA